MPGSNCLPLAGPDAKFLRRAAFLKHNLWVTQFHPDECFPGGEFPNQNPRIGEGLPTWVKQDRKLEDTDIVLWYVFGVTHIPRLEDWPVMPVANMWFSLMVSDSCLNIFYSWLWFGSIIDKHCSLIPAAEVAPAALYIGKTRCKWKTDALWDEYWKTTMFFTCASYTTESFYMLLGFHQRPQHKI